MKAVNVGMSASRRKTISCCLSQNVVDELFIVARVMLTNNCLTKTPWHLHATINTRTSSF